MPRTFVYTFGPIDPGYVRKNLTQFIESCQDPVYNKARACQQMKQFDSIARDAEARLQAGELYATRYRAGARLGKADLARARVIHRPTGKLAAQERRAARLGTRLGLGPIPQVMPGLGSALLVGHTQRTVEELGL